MGIFNSAIFNNRIFNTYVTGGGAIGDGDDGFIYQTLNDKMKNEAYRKKKKKQEEEARIAKSREAAVKKSLPVERYDTFVPESVPVKMRALLQDAKRRKAARLSKK